MGNKQGQADLIGTLGQPASEDGARIASDAASIVEKIDRVDSEMEQEAT